MNRDRPVGSVAAMVTVKQSRFQNVTNLIPNKVYEISKLRFMTGIIDFRAQHQRSIIHSHLVVGAEICRAAECNATACCWLWFRLTKPKTISFLFPWEMWWSNSQARDGMGWNLPHPVAVLRYVNHIYGHTVLAGVFPSHPPRVNKAKHCINTNLSMKNSKGLRNVQFWGSWLLLWKSGGWD